MPFRAAGRHSAMAPTGCMTGSGAIEVVPLHAQARDGAVTTPTGRPVWQEWTPPVPSMVANVLVAIFFGQFLFSNLRFFLRTGSYVGAGVLIFNTVLVACFLTRRPPTEVTGSIRNWILAPLTAGLPLLLRPVGSAQWPAVVVSTGGQVAGLIIMIASVMALNRSLGIVAANRGIKTRGLYARVRHPLYAGELLFFASFLVSNWSHPNALVVLAIILGQVVRTYQEEALLIQDGRYAAYRSAVPYRIIPRVY